MKRSTDRILTTHIGSLPRPDDLLELMQARENGKADDAAVAKRARQAVNDIVVRQIETGLDVINDGEQGKPSFLTYVNVRLGGFEPGGIRGSPWKDSREALSFPDFYGAALQGSGPSLAKMMICTGPVTYKGHAQLRAELATFKEALESKTYAEAFVPAISPSNIEEWQANNYYKTEEEYLFALADAMREEYAAIVDAGFLLQIDDPRLVTHYCVAPGLSVEDCRKWAMPRVEALNHALRGIPPEKVRFHTCYGINMGPRIHDMELKDIVDIMLKVHAGAFSFEASNPRHEHEWRVWAATKLPEGTVLIPGMITHSTVLVEHPDLVAERILRYAKIAGRENVIAGADCGFATFATSREIAPSIVWAKLDSLVKGARIASRELWGR
ncbi:MAG: cobalamin-independent methionine synthase II family protein [Xanthobacteraceae bacterium]